MDYYDYMEQCCSECDRIDPTEVNKIEEEALTKFREYLDLQFSKELNHIQGLRKDLEKREEALRKKQEAVDSRDVQLIKREQELDNRINSERQAAYKQAELALRDKFFNKYVPGTTVYFYVVEDILSTCPVCKGTGKISVTHTDDENKEHKYQITCPHCARYKYHQVPTGYSYQVYEGIIDRSYLKIESTRTENLLIRDDYMVEDTQVTVAYINKKSSRADLKSFYSSLEVEKKLFLNQDECEKAAQIEVERMMQELKEREEYNKP